VAISVAWQTVATVTSAATVYTIPNGTASSYGTYARDLVITNSGTATLFIGLSSGTVAATTSSFQVPAGGTVLLTQCQVPAGALVSATAATGTGQISVGFATNVNYF
jgi:hypothetical protein